MGTCHRAWEAEGEPAQRREDRERLEIGWASKEHFDAFSKSHIICARCVGPWVPRYRTVLSETADSWAGFMLGGPVVDVCPNLTSITTAHFRRYLLLSGRSNITLDRPDFAYIKYKWSLIILSFPPVWSVPHSNKMLPPKIKPVFEQVWIGINRRLPDLQSTWTPKALIIWMSPLLWAEKNLSHCPISMPRSWAKNYRTSFGTSSLGHSKKEIYSLHHEFITATRRLLCWYVLSFYVSSRPYGVYIIFFIYLPFFFWS